jgi:hypothetical protein
MGVEMSKGLKDRDKSAADAAGDASRSAIESGVLPWGLLDELEREPPWQVVRAYVMRGEHRDWVEGHAARSPAFRDVLEALRNDEDDRQAKGRRRVVVALPRR